MRRMSDAFCLSFALMLGCITGCGGRSPEAQERVLIAEQTNQLARGFAQAAESHLRLYDLSAGQKDDRTSAELRKDMAADIDAIDAFFASGAGEGHIALADSAVLARLKTVRGDLAARLAKPAPAAPAAPPKKK